MQISAANFESSGGGKLDGQIPVNLRTVCKLSDWKWNQKARAYLNERQARREVSPRSRIGLGWDGHIRHDSRI